MITLPLYYEVFDGFDRLKINRFIIDYVIDVINGIIINTFLLKTNINMV